jgi:pantoate kinase
MRSARVVRRSAFAPAHVTGIFLPDLEARDPRGRGSRGAGLVLDVGAAAEVEWDPGGDRAVRAADSHGRPIPITEEAVTHLVGPAPGSVRIRVTHDLPVGQGFGMSAAGTLAASLALGAALGRPRRRSIEVAHLAELLGGGGLGGVPAILGGGIEVRTAPGVPPWGRIVHRPFTRPVVVGTVGGPMPSPGLLRDPRFLERIRRAASEDLADLGSGPAPDDLLAASERFTDRLRLAPRPLARTIDRLRERGARAAQAMFGRSFFAVPPDARTEASLLEFLREQRIPARTVRGATLGARVGVRGRPTQAF